MVDIRGMDSILHLKSGIAYLENNDLVVMEELAGREEFAGYNLISVPAEETYACNCVLVNGWVLVPAGFPRACERTGTSRLQNVTAGDVGIPQDGRRTELPVVAILEMRLGHPAAMGRTQSNLLLPFPSDDLRKWRGRRDSNPRPLP